MSGFLLDTNVISETRKGETGPYSYAVDRCD